MTSYRSDDENSGPCLEIVCLEDVKAKAIEWFWQSRIALGKVTVLAGEGGLGKSTILCDLAARTTTGANWPDGAQNGGTGTVIILAAEDAVDDTLKPRLAAASADMSKVYSVSAVREQKG
jgi:RecA-family ATPase